MNWEALGAIAEMVAGVAVLITLIYLAIQVRQNTAMSREAILRNQTDRNMDDSEFIAGTPGLMDVYIRAMDDPDQVTREERWRFGSYMYGMFLDFQEAYHFNKSRRQKDYWWPMSRKIRGKIRGQLGFKNQVQHVSALPLVLVPSDPVVF